jgi:type I restriction enzyme S subunit
MSKVFLGDVAKERKETCKGSKNGYPIVGLEHLTPEEITLSAWEEDKENTFSKVFHEGDILFGRRRAYLKKAVVAPFDGICSGDITVIEAIPEKVLPELLPFIIQNDALFDFAINKSAGSLSPRVKWENLKNYEFELPEMKKQRELAKVLWAMDATKKSYQKLLQKTDELVKSQFIEMFINSECGKNRNPLGQFIEQIRGVSYKPKDLRSHMDDVTFTLLRANNIANGQINFDEVQYVSSEKVSENQVIRDGDILMCGSSGSLEHVGKAALCCQASYGMTFGAFCKLIRLKSNLLMPAYIAAYFASNEYRETIMQLANGSNINNLKTEHIDNLLIPVPDKEQQEQFVALAQQSDKSKFELEQALAELMATYKKIISENLG